MNKFSIYIFCILIYLGIDKGLLQSQNVHPIIQQNSELSDLSESFPLNLILINQFEIGIIIKSYFHTYKIVYGFKPPEYFTLQVSPLFFRENKDNIGYTLFSRFDNRLENYLLTPPGTPFIGTKKYGDWVLGNSSILEWKFNENYINLSEELGLKNVLITQRYYQQLRIHLERNLPFVRNKDWGIQGNFVEALSIKRPTNSSLYAINWNHLRNTLFSIPNLQRVNHHE